jgi:hypothetical protein
MQRNYRASFMWKKSILRATKIFFLTKETRLPTVANMKDNVARLRKWIPASRIATQLPQGTSVIEHGPFSALSRRSKSFVSCEESPPSCTHPHLACSYMHLPARVPFDSWNMFHSPCRKFTSPYQHHGSRTAWRKVRASPIRKK